MAVSVDAFFHGLAERVKDHLIISDLPADLDELIATTIRIDKRLHERDQDQGH